MTLRHEFISCSALHLMGSVSLTLRHEFISCSALTSVGSISLTLRHFNFAVDHSPTSRLWACWDCLLIVFLCLFFSFFGSPAVSTSEAGLIALEDGLNAAAIHVLAKKASWPRPKQV